MHLAPRLPSSRMFRSLIVLLLDTCFLLEELPLHCPQWLHMQALHGLDRLCQFPPARKTCGQFCAQVNWSVTYPDIPHVYLICLFIHFISYVFIHVYSFFSWHVRLGFRVLKYPWSGLLLAAQDWLASVVNFSRNIEKWCGFVFCYAMMLFNSFCHQGISSSFAPHVTLFCIFSYRFEVRTDFNFAYCSTDDSPVVLAVLATWLSWKLGTNSAQGIALLDCSTGSPLRSCQCLSVSVRSVRSVSILEFGFQRDRN